MGVHYIECKNHKRKRKPEEKKPNNVFKWCSSEENYKSKTADSEDYQKNFIGNRAGILGKKGNSRKWTAFGIVLLIATSTAFFLFFHFGIFRWDHLFVIHAPMDFIALYGFSLLVMEFSLGIYLAAETVRFVLPIAFGILLSPVVLAICLGNSAGIILAVLFFLFAVIHFLRIL